MRQGLLQIIGKHRCPYQVGRGPAIVSTRRLRAEVSPVVEIAVAAAEPHQRDEVDLLVYIQPASEPDSSERSVILL